MKKTAIIIGLIILAGSYSIVSAQFIQNSSRSLFSDVKAFKPGDAIMVLIMEDTQADNSANTDEKRSTDLNLGFSVNTGSGSTPINGSLGTGNAFKGQGSTSRSERIRSRLSARVDSVDANGNLLINGTRTTKINGEDQTVVIRGVVRPVDVSPENSINSYNILNLTLQITGNGSVTQTQEPGLITKFLRMLF